MDGLSNKELKNLIRRVIRETIEKYNVRQGGITRQTIMDGITLFHRPKDSMVRIGGESLSVIDSVFKYGFSREFTGSNGGNMYGAGVYSVYNLNSAMEKANGYGNSIIMLKLLGGYKDFLIGEVDLAKQIYGDNWPIPQQIRILYPDKADKVFASLKRFAMTASDQSTPIVVDLDGNEVPNNGEFRRSADTLYAISKILMGDAINGKCRGYVYNGGHDGDCCFIFDFQSVVPVALSKDGGQTWVNKLTDELIDRVNTTVDTKFQYGTKFKEVADKCINGYTKVWSDDGKINYIPSDSNNTISDVWFEDGSNWMNEDGVLCAEVEYNGILLYISKEDDGQYYVYSMDWEPQCELSELSSLVASAVNENSKKNKPRERR